MRIVNQFVVRTVTCALALGCVTVEAAAQGQLGRGASAGGSLRAGPSAADIATPRPAGGLRTRPLSAGQRQALGQANGQLAAGWYPLGAVDIARLQAGQGWTSAEYMAARHVPVYVPVPYSARVVGWVRDTTVRPVQAWRDVLVDEQLCDAAGCVERRLPMRAPWVNVCRCYGFRDRAGRFWTVE